MWTLIGAGMTFFGINLLDPAYVSHDAITYDNISDMIEMYFVDYGIIDSLVLELDTSVEQMQAI